MLAGIGAEHAPHLRAHFFGEGLQRALGHQHIVRRDAGLPGIEQLAVGDALGRLLEVGERVDDRRRLAAELERHGREVAPPRPPRPAGRPGRAGEDQMIEGQACEGFCDLVLDAGDEQLGGIEFAATVSFSSAEKCGDEFARLDDDTVAGGERAVAGASVELQRIIPGRDDADDAERLRHQPVARGQELQRRRHALRRHPALEVLGGMPDLGEHHHGLGDGGLDRASGGRNRPRSPAGSAPRCPRRQRAAAPAGRAARRGQAPARPATARPWHGRPLRGPEAGRSSGDGPRALRGTFQGVVHGVLPFKWRFRLVLLPQAGPLRNFWQGRAKQAANSSIALS